MSKKAYVEGEVLVKDGNTTNIEFYEEEFILDECVKDIAEARRVIKKALIQDRLQKKVSNFKRVRTCQVLKFEESGEKSETSDLDKIMYEAIELDCVPENIANYKRTDYKIKALEQAVANKKAKLAEIKPTKGNETDLGYVE